MNIDPVTTEVVASRLRETAATMEYALYHSGYSPILRESKDGTAGLTDPSGPRRHRRAAASSSTSPPIEQAVQAVLARYPRGEAASRATASSATIPTSAAARTRPTSCAVTPAFHQRRADRLRRQPRAQVGHRRHRAGLRRAPRRARSITTACCCRRCGSRPRRASRKRSRRSSPTTAASPRSCSAICARKSAATRHRRASELAALCDEYGRDTVLEVMASLMRADARGASKAELRGWRDGERRGRGLPRS